MATRKGRVGNTKPSSGNREGSAGNTNLSGDNQKGSAGNTKLSSGHVLAILYDVVATQKEVLATLS